MAMIDEEKLQGRIFEILDLLRKQTQCCRVANTQWAQSSGTGGFVFVEIMESGDIKVFSPGPGGTELTPAEYGVLSH